jgi:hypothetical protein
VVSKRNTGRLGDSNHDVSGHGHGAAAVLADLPCSVAEQRWHGDGRTACTSSSASAQPTFLSQPCRSVFGNKSASCRAYIGLQQLDVSEPVVHHVSRHPQSTLCLARHIFPFQVLQFQFQFTFPAIPVCLGIQRTRATPQEHRFEVLRQPNTAILFASDALETARALCGLDTLWRWRREEFWRVGGPVLGQPLVWGKFGSWVGVCTCISRSLVCWQPWPLRV